MVRSLATHPRSAPCGRERESKSVRKSPELILLISTEAENVDKQAQLVDNSGHATKIFSHRDNAAWHFHGLLSKPA
jgi:hypothetical protein